MAGTSQAILSPLHLLGVLTRAKSFEANPILGSRWLNTHGLHAARVRLAHRVATRRRAYLESLISAPDREAFARDGFVLRSNFLPAETFAALLAEIKTYRGSAQQIAQGSTINRKLAVGPAAVAAIPSLRALLTSPDWRGLIRYIGSRDADPAVFIQTIIRRPGEGAEDPQTFLHADTFHPTVKAWFFLTDVAEDGGPFVYVPGSHRLTPERLAWERKMSIDARRSANRETREGSFRLAAAELPALGLPPPRVFAVPANTLVVADTFGFHARGPSLRPSMRVEIWALGARSPFTPWTGLGMRGLKRRGQALTWRSRAAERLESLPAPGFARSRHIAASAFDGA